MLKITMAAYSVKKLSSLAGVSVRTLHLYDEIGLLKPSVRTAARYRLYGEDELLRLQQILFYKELDFPLQDIKSILDDPDFDIVVALEHHREALQSRKERLTTLLGTIDRTIFKIKNGMTLSHDELYEGLPKETAEAWRTEAIEKYGADAVQRSEKSLGKLGKDAFAKLKTEASTVTLKLISRMKEDPTSPAVQEIIAQHYNVIRQFWGTADYTDKQAEAYEGLGELYVSDTRYAMVDGKPNADFAEFMQKAMRHFARTQLV